MLYHILLPFVLAQTSPPVDVIEAVEASVVRSNADGKGVTWFHPRGCVVPDPKGAFALLTQQWIKGSDYFGPVCWSVSNDGAKTWSEPKEIPGMGRIRREDGQEEGVCDVVPDYHAKSGTVLALGHSVLYKGGKYVPSPLPRWPVYTVRSRDGAWSEKKKLEWDDPRGKYIYTPGSSQRLTLADGDLLIPMSFSAEQKAPRSVATFLCGYDGKTLTIKKVGTALPFKKGRGFLEPSLTVLDGVYYMTIRAEDGHGYVTRSKDGLTWDKPVVWAWQDGKALAMSTTQQHWLPHSDGLYLVYTRKAAENAKVFRWRSPLYLALVDRETLRLLANTERVVFPLGGDGVKNVPLSGNFHTMMLTANESLITDGQMSPSNRWRGDQVQARVRWKSPNKLVTQP